MCVDTDLFRHIVAFQALCNVTLCYTKPKSIYLYEFYRQVIICGLISSLWGLHRTCRSYLQHVEIVLLE